MVRQGTFATEIAEATVLGQHLPASRKQAMVCRTTKHGNACRNAWAILLQYRIAVKVRPIDGIIFRSKHLHANRATSIYGLSNQRIVQRMLGPFVIPHKLRPRRRLCWPNRITASERLVST